MQRQYNKNRRNNNRPSNAEEQQLADAVNELAALELQIAQNELTGQQGNNEAELDQQPPQQFDNIQPNQPAQQLNANQHQQLFFNLLQPHYIGMMENAYLHCHAKCMSSFNGEQNAKNLFTKCCFQGKVTLPPVTLPSANIIELFSAETPQSRHFLENIRHYNTALEMASWNATVECHCCYYSWANIPLDKCSRCT